jgi:2-oxoisovalerate dehydrogenase E1 component
LGERGINTRVLDLRWLSPLPISDIVEAAQASGKVLIADETRHTGGVSEAVVTALIDNGCTAPMARVTSEDTFVPLGPATEAVLLGDTHIEAAAAELLGV